MKTLRVLLLAGLCTLAAPTRAQNIAPATSLPIWELNGASIIGLGSNSAGLDLFTTRYYYTAPLYAGSGGLTFTRGIDISTGIPFLNILSLAFVDPAPWPPTFYFTASQGPFQRLYTAVMSPIQLSSVILSGPSEPLTGGALGSDSSIYLAVPNLGSVSKYSLPATGTPTLTFGADHLTTPTAMSFGPDGLLYVIDSADNRIVSFDTSDGAFQSEFSLALPVANSGMAISLDGRIFLSKPAAVPDGDVWQVADIYSLGGDLLGHLTTPTNDTGINTGKPSMTINGDTLYWTSGQGANVYAYVVPEPSATALAIGAGALVLAFARQRRHHS